MPKKKGMYDTNRAKKQKPPQIIMSFNDGVECKSPVLLLKALTVIESLPSSMAFKDNYVMFENQQNEIIKLKRIFSNKWVLTVLNRIEKNSNPLEYKYLSTNLVNIIVINFFMGNFIGKYLKSSNDKAQNQKVRSVFDKISELLAKWLVCPYCGNNIKKLFKLSCDYCNEKMDINDFYFKI